MGSEPAPREEPPDDDDANVADDAGDETARLFRSARSLLEQVLAEDDAAAAPVLADADDDDDDDAVGDYEHGAAAEDLQYEDDLDEDEDEDEDEDDRLMAEIQNMAARLGSCATPAAAGRPGLGGGGGAALAAGPDEDEDEEESRLLREIAQVALRVGLQKREEAPEMQGQAAPPVDATLPPLIASIRGKPSREELAKVRTLLQGVTEALRQNQATQHRVVPLYLDRKRAIEHTFQRLSASDGEARKARAKSKRWEPRGRPRTAGAPFTHPETGDGPPQLARALEAMKAFKRQHPICLRVAEWSKALHDLLRAGVLKQVKEKAYTALMRQIQDDKTARKAPRSLRELQHDIKKVSQLKLDDPEVRERVDWDKDIDWDRVASEYVKSSRTADQCKAEWLHRISPDVNTSQWTADEEAALLALAEKHHRRDWASIARQLATNRTAAACLQHFQRNHNSTLLRHSWTDEEDRRLATVVHKHSTKEWHRIAEFFPNRSRDQVMQRWFKVLSPKVRGKWTDAETSRLRNAVALYGKNWSLVATCVPGRSDQQCRERFHQVLDPSMHRASFSAAEDKALLDAVGKWKGEDGKIKWAAVAKEVGTRTDNQCLRRWKRIDEHLNRPFTAEEDSIVTEACKKALSDGVRISWSTVASMLKDRKDIQVVQRWKMLQDKTVRAPAQTSCEQPECCQQEGTRPGQRKRRRQTSAAGGSNKEDPRCERPESGASHQVRKGSTSASAASGSNSSALPNPGAVKRRKAPANKRFQLEGIPLGARQR